MSILDIAILVVVVAGILGVVIYGIWYKLTHSPKSWKMDGPAPAKVSDALEVIRGMLPKSPERWGGIIHWVWTPIEFKDPDGSKHLAAGIVTDVNIPEMKVQWFKNVWETALAHEVIHCFTGWADGDPRLQPLVVKMNAAIKEKLAAVS